MVQQITWQNVNAPNLKNASDIMADAVAGFSRGTTGIADNLQGIRDRQRTNRSAAAYPLLAGINSGGNVDDILGRVNASVRPEDMTPELQTAMLEARGLGLGYDSTRAGTNSTNSATRRENTEFDRTIARENELSGLTGAYARSQENAKWGSSGMPQTDRAQAIKAGLVSRGMPEHIAEGFVMNFQDESGLDPTARGDNGNAYGLGQWNGPRMANLLAYAEQTGRSAADPEVQMDFLMEETKGSEAGAYAKIASTGDSRTAAAAIVNHFERPAEEHRARREAAYLGGNGMNISGQIGPNTMLRPQDLDPLYNNVYDAQRTTLADNRFDLDYNVKEEARLKAQKEVDDAAKMVADVNNRFEAMLPRLDPSSSLEDLNGLIRDQNLPPALRDAMLAAASGKFDANRGVFTDGQAPLPITEMSQAADAVMLQVSSTMGNDPLVAGLVSAGVLPNTDAAVADMTAPDGMVKANTSVGSQSGSLLEQANSLMPDNPEAAATSVTDMMTSIESVYEKFGGNIPRNVITAMARQSMTVDQSIFGDTIKFDENLLIEQLTPIGTPSAYRKYVAEQAAKIAEAQDLKAANTAFQTARTDLNYWENSNANGANVQADQARAAMKAAFEKVSEMGLADAAKNNAADAGMTESEFADSQAAAAKAASEEVAAGKSSEANRLAIVRSAGIGSESIRPVQADSSRVGQWFQENGRREDVANAISTMRRDLAGQGAGSINSAINSFSPFRSKAEADKNTAARTGTNAAYEWLDSPAATQLFMEQPALVEKAKKDPETFYQEYVAKADRQGRYQPTEGDAARAKQKAMDEAFANATKYRTPQ